MIYFDKLKVGEGIAGPSTIGLGTPLTRDGISIAFVNRMEQVGGLYHCPARQFRNAAISGTIRQMINDIEPDEIVVTPPASRGNGCSEADVEAVTEFLRGTGIWVTVKDSGHNAQLLWRWGDPVLNERPCAQPAPQCSGAAMPEGIGGVPSRKLTANIWCYGETDGNPMPRCM